MGYEIKIYKTATGKCPFQQWLHDLDDLRAKAAISLRLERIGLGNFGNCKALGDGINELKIDIGPGYRIYFSTIGRQVILLLCAGDKRSQKKDMATAKAYFQDFKEWRKNENKKNN